MATDQKPQKNRKTSYYPPSHRVGLSVNVLLSNMTLFTAKGNRKNPELQHSAHTSKCKQRRRKQFEVEEAEELECGGCAPPRKKICPNMACCGAF